MSSCWLIRVGSNVGDELMCLESIWPRLPIVKVGANLSTTSFQAMCPTRTTPSTDIVALELLSLRFGVWIDYVWLRK